jgi:hypothetical protein
MINTPGMAVLMTFMACHGCEKGLRLTDKRIGGRYQASDARHILCAAVYAAGGLN